MAGEGHIRWRKGGTSGGADGHHMQGCRGPDPGAFLRQDLPSTGGKNRGEDGGRRVQQGSCFGGQGLGILGIGQA